MFNSPTAERLLFFLAARCVETQPDRPDGATATLKQREVVCLPMNAKAFVRLHRKLFHS